MFDSMDLNALLPTRSSDDSQDVVDEGCELCPSLTWRERVIGCATCMIGGYILSFGAFFRFSQVLVGNPLPFVLNATVGNIIALCGSFFMTGPKAQAKKMWHETRRIATALYLGSLVSTLLVALMRFPGQAFLLLLLILCQYVAIAWYCLSYIPFARDYVKRWCCQLVSEEG